MRAVQVSLCLGLLLAVLAAQAQEDPRHSAEEALKKARESLERTIGEVMREAQQKALEEVLAEQDKDSVGGGLQNELDSQNFKDASKIELPVDGPTGVPSYSFSTERSERFDSSTSSLIAEPSSASKDGKSAIDPEDLLAQEGSQVGSPFRLVIPLNRAAEDFPWISKETSTIPSLDAASTSSALEPRESRRNGAAPGVCPNKQPEPLQLPTLPNGIPDSDNEQCARESRLIDLHLRNHTLWAVQMQDAGSGGTSGVLVGNVYHLGDFDECLEVSGPVLSQYCMAEIRVLTPPRTADYHYHPDIQPDPMQSVWNHIKHEGEEWRLPLDSLHAALCAPASCPPHQLQAAVQRALDTHANCTRLPVEYSVTVTEEMCSSAARMTPPLSTGEAAFIILVVFVAFSAIGGSLIDWYATKKKGCALSFLLLFSLPRNWRMLTKPDPRPVGLDLDALSGARTLNMLMLVLGHRGFNTLRGPVHNYNYFEAIPRHVHHTGATHAQLFVDTCFVMSGLLVSLLELTRAHTIGIKHCNSEGRPGIVGAVMRRYLRLTPSYAMVVFFYATIFWRLGSGPLWNQVIGYESEACAKYWWTNIFYVNNYIHTDKLCMFQSWYLPCDLHLFAVGIALTLVLARHRRTGLALIAVCLAAAMSVPFVVTVIGKKPALLEMLPGLFLAPDQSANFRTMYAPTHMRAAPYVVGLLAGYFFHMHGLRVKEQYSQAVTWLLCLGGMALSLACMLSSVVFYDPDLPYNKWTAGIYAALCPVVWSIGVCLVFASLVLGSRTPMSVVLSWRPLVILSRLTYNVYLTHWAFQLASVAKARAPIHLDVYNIFSWTFEDLVSSFAVAVVLFMLVEAPFRSLARHMSAPPKESKVHQQPRDEEKPPALDAVPKRFKLTGHPIKTPPTAGTKASIILT